MDNYKIVTEDRKFIKCIKTLSQSLRKSGLTNIYFFSCFKVASIQFTLIAIKNIKVETLVNPHF